MRFDQRRYNEDPNLNFNPATMIIAWFKSWPTGLLAILILLIQSTIVHYNVDAYKTYELVQYCQGFDSKMKFPIENQNNKIMKYGVIVPKFEYDNEHHRDFDGGYSEDEDLLKFDPNTIGETVTVGTGYDSSAVRLVVEAENIFRARLQCSILVMPKKPNGLIVSLRKLHVRPGIDWLKISINNSSFTRTFSHIRINGERDSVAYVAHHGVLIQFGTKAFLPKNERVEIDLILTSFREADLCDIDKEFDCGSFRCISNNYLCDGFNNCGDSRDETNCPIDNITNYLLVSTALLLVAFFIFLCFCYRCCFQKRERQAPSYRKQYQYLRIRTNSQPKSSYVPKFRSNSVQSEADLNSNLRRVKFAHVGDSMPILLSPAGSLDYGSTGNTYFMPYQPYALSLANGQNNRYGLFPLIPSSSSRHETIPEHHTFPLPQPVYPPLHSQLFTPPLASSTNVSSTHPPPPPYSFTDPELKTNSDAKNKQKE